jgi:hypothetical protein
MVSENYELYDYLPLSVKFEFIGISSNPTLRFLAKMYGQPPMLLGKPLPSYKPEELLRVLDNYNVSYVVAFTLQSRSRFDRYPEYFKPLPLKKPKKPETKGKKEIKYPPEVDPFRIYKVLGGGYR